MNGSGPNTISSLLYSEDALADLHAINAWTVHHHGRDQSANYIDGLERACLRLLQYPASAPVYAGAGKKYRVMRYRSHRIFYRPQGSDLLIVRILHTAQNAGQTIG